MGGAWAWCLGPTSPRCVCRMEKGGGGGGVRCCCWGGGECFKRVPLAPPPPGFWTPPPSPPPPPAALPHRERAAPGAAVPRGARRARGARRHAAHGPGLDAGPRHPRRPAHDRVQVRQPWPACRSSKESSSRAQCCVAVAGGRSADTLSSPRRRNETVNETVNWTDVARSPAPLPLPACSAPDYPQFVPDGADRYNNLAAVAVLTPPLWHTPDMRQYAAAHPRPEVRVWGGGARAWCAGGGVSAIGQGWTFPALWSCCGCCPLTPSLSPGLHSPPTRTHTHTRRQLIPAFTRPPAPPCAPHRPAPTMSCASPTATKSLSPPPLTSAA